MAKLVKYGMVGGSMSAFIGEVHRKAINFDPRVEFVAGCFSTNAQKNAEVAEVYDLDPSRVYADYVEMAEKEGSRDDGIDFVSIVTPNNLHYPVAKAFLENGINVVCEKPFCFEIEQAQELVELAKRKKLLLGLTYTYTGYTMVKVMKEMIANGAIGKIVSINAEYLQEWLIDALKKDPSEIPIWRTNPEFTGVANCVGDIGTHIENMVFYLTGLHIKRLAATTNTFGQNLELNANMLVQFENGVNGSYWCSQVASGKLNGLSVRLFGDAGSIEWEQHYPDYVRYTPIGKPTRILSRGTGYILEKAGATSRIPAGHPEGLYVAFANIYKNFTSALIKNRAGQPLTKDDLDFPSGEEGLNGVKFVHAVVNSAASNSAWMEI